MTGQAARSNFLLLEGGQGRGWGRAVALSGSRAHPGGIGGLVWVVLGAGREGAIPAGSDAWALRTGQLGSGVEAGWGQGPQ